MSAFWSLVLIAGGGSLLVSWWRGRRLGVVQRIAPHLRLYGSSTASANPGDAAHPIHGNRWGPFFREASAIASRLGSPTRDLERRLARSGSRATVDEFRLEQVVWGMAGTIGGVGFSILLAVTRGSGPMALLTLTLALGVGGILARDYMLSRTIAGREAEMLAELPTASEMLALAVSAGEGVANALDRVSRLIPGALGDELRWTLGSAKAGEPLPRALRGLADRTGVASLRRFADTIAIAIDRGTPLTDVLHAQAQDIREAERRHLMESGGKKEIAMMIPVVFLILPITVVFAVFPGVVAINLGT